MFKHRRKDDFEPYEAPKTRSKVHNEVSEELAGTESFLTDTQGLKLAYENPDGIYQNGSILYIAGTKSGRDVYDDLKLPFFKQDTRKDTKMLINSSKTVPLKLTVRNTMELLILSVIA